MTIVPKDICEKEEIKVIGFSIIESLNSVLEHKTVRMLREELTKRKHEVKNKRREGIYLIQIYPAKGEWTPDVPYEHIVGIEVKSLEEIPDGMMGHIVPAGRYANFVHKGPESAIGKTYDLINQYSLRPFDIEYWDDIETLENQNSHIDIYIPVTQKL
ncbi:GyrI-like domain-containing protein [Bacillus alkalicellulosilyticus]|uniref:GyrI-like domain-containing protein n=1 Tax=Alkalihalobacterium alkalicellulosilyticum TaxID=1912214 RepID=UPI001482C810|nr:effector binding domain-containing protein [Bacillus alkalicellulosilyticus]